VTHDAALEPLTTHFGALKITYEPRVLAPRNWTLAQSFWASEIAAWAPPGPILELHCGAGHIGLAAAQLSHRPLVQIDRNPVACELARLNADRAGLGEQIEVRIATLPNGLLPEERFPIIVADPPYLPSDEVIQYPNDPVSAIDGGDDGLDGVRCCLGVAARHLDERGMCILQLRTRAQADQVSAIPSGLATIGTRCIDGAGVLVGLRLASAPPGAATDQATRSTSSAMSSTR
jgi:release factor glutamine methyltransferase